uniref:26S proteasome non-ATPase regulatory subunit 5 n=1 Tax=Meloidogyne javanica TaxID=6303 RepID=A0A915LU14_MELJA
MKDQIDNNRELRSKIKDDVFIGQQLSLLSPGIDNSEKRFLVHEFTRSAMLLPDFNEYQRLSPLINALVNEVDSNDLLGCSTALEMLADIASSKQENINYFESIGLLQKIYKLFQTTKEDTDMGITHTACIRFFGYLSTTDSNALEKFPIFTSDVFDAIYHFDSLDPLRRKLAFETFAVVTKTIGAKRFLSSENCKLFFKGPYNIAKAFNCLAVAIARGSATPERKAWYLDNITTIFGNVESAESSNILKIWFNYLGEHFPKLLFDCLKKLIPELQIASLNALIALMKHQWAPEYFCLIDGFINFLLDREIHFSTIGYQLKYDLICRFIEIKPSSINSDLMEKLIIYRNMGVYAPPERQLIATKKID